MRTDDECLSEFQRGWEEGARWRNAVYEPAIVALRRIAGGESNDPQALRELAEWGLRRSAEVIPGSQK